MQFNSGVFLQFFAAFVLLYWLVRHHLRWRNVLIVAASYLFYGWWDYRFLSLLLVSTVLDYVVALALGPDRPTSTRKAILAASMAGNLAMLGFFKYYDFFVSSFARLLNEAGLPFRTATLGIVLPVGISFYTFQTMSYTIDVYRRQIAPTRDLVAFMAYVSFFPQLVAGPIERARHLLPQFEVPRRITLGMVERGMDLVLVGLFKKVVLADNLAPLVEIVYGHPPYAGPLVILATVAFGFQIYCDFAGYSDIARGLAAMLGFDIMVNFNRPYQASSLREFWHRWHISFSTWLRDYLYVPLGGNRHGQLNTARNLFVTMLLGGLWHGAAWNFVAWGAYHGAGLIVDRRWRGKTESIEDSAMFPSRVTRWALTMAFVFYGWLLFRAGSMRQIRDMTVALGTFQLPNWGWSYLLNLGAFTLPLLLLERVYFFSTWLKATGQAVLVLAIVLYWERAVTPFIYFQF